MTSTLGMIQEYFYLPYYRSSPDLLAVHVENSYQNIQVTVNSTLSLTTFLLYEYQLHISRSMNTCACKPCSLFVAVAAERMELKEALSKQLASFKVHTIQTSRLWRDLRSGQQQQQRRKGIPVHVVAASDLSFSIREGRLKVKSRAQALVEEEESSLLSLSPAR